VLLECLLAGETLSQGIAAAAALEGESGALVHSLGGWFAAWAQAGFFLDLRIDTGTA
jgi:hypothetical protein